MSVSTTDQYETPLSARGDSERKDSKKDPTFMLLDVREREEYDKCHIDGGEESREACVTHAMRHATSHRYDASTFHRAHVTCVPCCSHALPCDRSEA